MEKKPYSPAVKNYSYTASYQKQDEENMKRLGFTADNIPYPPQVRGHYSENGKQFVNVVEHNGSSGWVEVGGTLSNSGWKVEAIDEGKNQVRLSAFGVPARVDIGYGVPTGDVYRPYKVVTPENYQAEFQDFTEAKHKNFQNGFKDMYDKVYTPSPKELAMQKVQNGNKETGYVYTPSFGQGGGNWSAQDNSVKDVVKTGDDQDLETGDNNPSYQYSPDVMDRIRSNYAESGGDPTNVKSLQEFREMQKNGTAKEGVNYLVPSTKQGKTDFDIWNHFDTKPE